MAGVAMNAAQIPGHCLEGSYSKELAEMQQISQEQAMALYWLSH